MNKIIEAATETIIDNLKSRRGLLETWDELDIDTQNDIKKDISDIIYITMTQGVYSADLETDRRALKMLGI